jgi:hypothetical protein
MRSAAWALCVALVVPAVSRADGRSAKADNQPREMRFTGTAAVATLCACLLDARRNAEAQGRLDFSAAVESTGAGESLDVTARIWMGSAHAVGHIDFAGHTSIGDTTLRRAMTVRERDLLDVGQLRRSLARIDTLGMFEPLTLADVQVNRRDDGVTADLTVALRERKRRWWSISGPMLPGVGPLQASVSSRLPPWGRGVFEAATFFVSLNVTGFARPFLSLERPVLPGRELLSGFAISPALSPRATLMHYGRTHLAHGIGALLHADALDAMAIPITSDGQLQAEPLVCTPPAPRLWWLRRGAETAISLAVAALPLP